MKLSTPLGNVVQLHVLIKALATLNLIEIWCSCLCMNLKKKNQNEKSDFRKSLLFLSTEVPVLSNMESGGQCSHVQIQKEKGWKIQTFSIQIGKLLKQKIILMKLQNCQENSKCPSDPPPPNRNFFWKRHVNYIYKKLDQTNELYIGLSYLKRSTFIKVTCTRVWRNYFKVHEGILYFNFCCFDYNITW